MILPPPLPMIINFIIPPSVDVADLPDHLPDRYYHRADADHA